MIEIEFIKNGQGYLGFQAQGHSMSAPKGEDIICAAVSSACLMAANTVTEVVGLKADAKMEDGFLRFVITADPYSARDILEGLHIHLNQLALQYPDNINITTSEV